MRSKQQPRPSYHWINKNSNSETDDLSGTCITDPNSNYNETTKKTAGNLKENCNHLSSRNSIIVTETNEPSIFKNVTPKEANESTYSTDNHQNDSPQQPQLRPTKHETIINTEAPLQPTAELSKPISSLSLSPAESESAKACWNTFACSSVVTNSSTRDSDEKHTSHKRNPSDSAVRFASVTATNWATQPPVTRDQVLSPQATQSELQSLLLLRPRREQLGFLDFAHKSLENTRTRTNENEKNSDGDDKKRIELGEQQQQQRQQQQSITNSHFISSDTKNSKTSQRDNHYRIPEPTRESGVSLAVDSVIAPTSSISNLIDSHGDDDDNDDDASIGDDDNDVNWDKEMCITTNPNKKGASHHVGAAAPPSAATATAAASTLKLSQWTTPSDIGRGKSSYCTNNKNGGNWNQDQHQRQDPNVIAGPELTSPRCQSRESSGSGERCSSNGSNCSGNGSTAAPTPTPPSPVGMPLPATLAPAAAAALLPPQSAAMAAYLNVAAAAQQNRLLLSNPLAAAATLVQQAAQSSPNITIKEEGQQSSNLEDLSILDFSTKISRRISNESDGNNNSDSGDVVNLSKRRDVRTPISLPDGNYPLDLSIGSNRKRESLTGIEEICPFGQKLNRPNEYKPLPGAWIPPIHPYLAAVAATNVSPKTSHAVDWNGRNKMTTNEATKALEKMSEMSKFGESDSEMPSYNQNVGNDMITTTSHASVSGARHSAWQSHWLNKGADAAKDVFKCVWCKKSFPTLATLTVHMKETQHCGVHVSHSPSLSTTNSTVSHGSSGTQQQQQQQQHSHHVHHSQSRHHHQTTSSPSASSHQVTSTSLTHSSSTSSSSNKSDLNLLIKETMPIPRKLVRGQDVWLGKGAEQTRQILKCMWCGQSFRSLAEMTSHMQQTQHYTNIISQEQIISWKSSDDKGSGSGTNGSPPASTGATTVQSSAASAAANMSASAQSAGVSNGSLGMNSNSTVSAVLTCKVCDQAFSSLKDLSNHIVKNAHYKEHVMRAVSETSGRRRQTREKRKKSLPVRKLLELERAQQDFKNGDVKQLRDLGISTKITCERCGDRVETALFVEHIRMCIDSTVSTLSRNNAIKTPYNTDGLISPRTPCSLDGHKSMSGIDESTSPASSQRHISPHVSDLTSPLSKDSVAGGGVGGEKTLSSPSVLNAIEQLIEKSFDTRSRNSSNTYAGVNNSTTPLGASILKRLGIDESVDYSKPLMDPQTLHLLRSYQQSHHQHTERSGSESSSVSDRGSSRLDTLTPERQSETSRQPTPHHSPEKSLTNSDYKYTNANNIDRIYKFKSELVENDHVEVSALDERSEKISVKKEFSVTAAKETTGNSEKVTTPISPSNRLTTMTPAASPAASDRSLTPRSVTSDKKQVTAGDSCLNALSTMFDNLNAMNSQHTAIGGETNNNTTVSGDGKNTSSHPLAALQKLCEKTDSPGVQGNRQGADSGTNGVVGSVPATTNSQMQSSPHNGNNNSNIGNMVAFSWACNDAVMNSDSVIKCSFCDTPFCSKGAYRHHLSKVHFVKDTDIKMEALIMRSPPAPVSPKPHALSSSPKSNSYSSISTSLKNSHQHRQSPLSAGLNNTTDCLSAPMKSFDESPQSKFLKYTELAKQLSSKYV